MAVGVMLFSSFTPAQTDYYVWHWHLKHEMDQKSVNTLKSIPIKGVFYRTGHFGYAHAKPYFKGIRKHSQFFKKIQKMNEFEEMHLSYSFGNSASEPFVKKYLNATPKAAIEYISTKILHEFRLYKSVWKNLTGVQIDLEGGGINFGIFADLLSALKAKIPDTVISITPMSSWYKKPKFKQVADLSDLVVPMLYDFHRGKTSNAPLKVTDLEWLKKVSRGWDQLGRPVLFGLPTYSYSVFYDEKTKMKIPWAQVSPEFATQNQHMEMSLSTYNETGPKNSSYQSRDRLIEYTVPKKVTYSNITFRKGSKLRYNFLSPSAVSQYIEAVRGQETPNSRGIAFFRFGLPGEKLVLDAWRLKAAISGNFSKQAKFRLDVIPLGPSESRPSERTFRYALVNLSDNSYFGKEGMHASLQGAQILLKGAREDFDVVDPKDDQIHFRERYFSRYEMLLSPMMTSEQDELELKLSFEKANGMTYRGSKTFSTSKKKSYYFGPK